MVTGEDRHPSAVFKVTDGGPCAVWGLVGLSGQSFMGRTELGLRTPETLPHLTSGRPEGPESRSPS